MKLYWEAADNRSESRKKLLPLGVGYGYNNHTLSMIRAVLDAGIEITYDPEDSFDLAIHIVTPDKFDPLKGRKNLVFTMCESSPLAPADRGLNLDEATVLVVPCSHSKAEFHRYYPSVPIEICPEGFDPALFPYTERKLPSNRTRFGEPFRVLWLGAWTRRKGIDLAKAAWARWLQIGRMPANAQLYIKTSGVDVDGKKQFEGVLTQKAVMTNDGPIFCRSDRVMPSQPPLPGVVQDSRNLSPEDLAALYRSSHVFLFPSRGEGWGLGLSDALASGLPSIWTHWSAMKDYARKEEGYPLTKLTRGLIFDGCDRIDAYDAGFGMEPDVNDIVRKLDEIAHGYSEATRRAKIASERMHREYTWDMAGRRFIEICEKYA